MDKIRLGIVGTGSVVREIYQYLYFRSAYSHLFSVEAVADPNAAVRSEFCDHYDISPAKRFSDYKQMIDQVELDAIQVNTPDNLHEQPTIFALSKGLDVLVPKPLADSIGAAHRMIAAARDSGRYIAVDFHKRDDPRIKECQVCYQSGRYGQFQLAVWYMMDKLMVADPNHEPRFFASPDFAEINSPISFLTVHMVDAFLHIVNIKPIRVRAHAWSQKLPTLKPIAVHGHDLCDTEMTFANGGVAHIITGWHLPNTAHAMTVQSSRIICTDGYVDLGLDRCGYHEVTHEGIAERNPLFRNFEASGLVTGYGMSYPGRLYEKMLRYRNGDMSDEERTTMLDPFELGFYTTVVLEAAQQSLTGGARTAEGAIHGSDIDVATLVRNSLGGSAIA